MSDSFGDEKACRPYGTRNLLGDAYPPLKRWAKLFRPTRWDWSVVGSGSVDVPSRHPTLSVRENDRVPVKRETLSRQGQKSLAQPFKAGYASPNELRVPSGTANRT